MTKQMKKGKSMQVRHFETIAAQAEAAEVSVAADEPGAAEEKRRKEKAGTAEDGRSR